MDKSLALQGLSELPSPMDGADRRRIPNEAEAEDFLALLEAGIGSRAKEVVGVVEDLRKREDFSPVLEISNRLSSGDFKHKALPEADIVGKLFPEGLRPTVSSGGVDIGGADGDGETIARDFGAQKSERLPVPTRDDRIVQKEDLPTRAALYGLLSNSLLRQKGSRLPDVPSSGKPTVSGESFQKAFGVKEGHGQGGHSSAFVQGLQDVHYTVNPPVLAEHRDSGSLHTPMRRTLSGEVGEQSLSSEGFKMDRHTFREPRSEPGGRGDAYFLSQGHTPGNNTPLYRRTGIVAREYESVGGFSNLPRKTPNGRVVQAAEGYPSKASAADFGQGSVDGSLGRVVSSDGAALRSEISSIRPKPKGYSGNFVAKEPHTLFDRVGVDIIGRGEPLEPRDGTVVGRTDGVVSKKPSLLGGSEEQIPRVFDSRAVHHSPHGDILPAAEVSRGSMFVDSAGAEPVEFGSGLSVRRSVEFGGEDSGGTIRRIVEYVESNRPSLSRRLDVVVEHDELGRFGLRALREHSGRIGVSVTTETPEGQKFFENNKAQLAQALNSVGVRLADIRAAGQGESPVRFELPLETGRDGSSFAYSHDERGGEDAQSQRRRDLWEQYRERFQGGTDA